MTISRLSIPGVAEHFSPILDQKSVQLTTLINNSSGSVGDTAKITALSAELSVFTTMTATIMTAVKEAQQSLLRV